MSFAHDARRVKPSAHQIQALRGAAPHVVAFGPTFAALQPAPEAGPSAALWSLLTTIALLCALMAEASRPAAARVEAARLAHRLLQMGWRTWAAWEAEAAYQHPETYCLERLTVEQAGADLRRAEAVLRQLEAGLVGPVSLARTKYVRPVNTPLLEVAVG